MSIREAIEEVSAWAAETTFSTTEYTSGATGKTTLLIKDWKDLVTSVSDLQSLLGSLKDSRFFSAFEDTIAQYEAKLAMLDHVSVHVSPPSTCQHCSRVNIVHVSTSSTCQHCSCVTTASTCHHRSHVSPPSTCQSTCHHRPRVTTVHVSLRASTWHRCSRSSTRSSASGCTSSPSSPAAQCRSSRQELPPSYIPKHLAES